MIHPTYRSILVCGFALLWFHGQQGQGADGSVEADEQGTRRYHLGVCELQVDPGAPAAANGVVSCLRGTATTELGFAAGRPEENLWLYAGDLYAAVHVNRWLAFQTKGTGRRVQSLGKEVETSQGAWLEGAILSLGNPALDVARLSFGILQLPFGVNASNLMKALDLSTSPSYWRTPSRGAVVTVDNQTSTQIDLGVASESYKKIELESSKAPEEKENSAFTVRVMHDISPLDGSRLVGSFYSDRRGEHRYGFGLININLNGDTTHFELVRLFPKGEISDRDFRQIVRLTYLGIFRAGNRFIAQIDDERFEYRLGSIGFDFEARKWLLLRLSTGYRKSEREDRRSRWHFVTGVEASL